eukprot:216219_1
MSLVVTGFFRDANNSVPSIITSLASKYYTRVDDIFQYYTIKINHKTINISFGIFAYSGDSIEQFRKIIDNKLHEMYPNNVIFLQNIKINDNWIDINDSSVHITNVSTFKKDIIYANIKEIKDRCPNMVGNNCPIIQMVTHICEKHNYQPDCKCIHYNIDANNAIYYQQHIEDFYHKKQPCPLG